MILSAYAKRLAASLKAAGGAALIEFNAGTSYAAGTIGAAVKKLGQDLADLADGFTFTGPVALPGNAAQPLQAVPLQQMEAADAAVLEAAEAGNAENAAKLPRVVLMRGQQTRAVGADSNIYFTTEVQDTAGIVGGNSIPTFAAQVNSSIAVNMAAYNAGASSITRTFTLVVGGVVCAQAGPFTWAPGTTAHVSMTCVARQSGEVRVLVDNAASVIIQGTDFGWPDTLGVVVYP